MCQSRHQKGRKEGREERKKRQKGRKRRQGWRAGGKEEINILFLPKESKKAERQHSLFLGGRLIPICR